VIRPLPHLRRLQEYVKPIRPQEDHLNLDFNEHTLGPSPRVMHLLSRLHPVDLARYPEIGPYRSRFARLMRVPAARLHLCAGTDEAIRSLAGCFLDRRGEALIAEPTFGMYRFYVEASGARLRSVRYGPDLAFPGRELLRAIGPSTRLIFLAHPNNPTGMGVPAGALRLILRKARNALVVVDEAYYPFCPRSYASWLRRYPNLVILRTFSKACGLGGMRVGWVMGAPEVISVLERTASPYRVNSAALKLAEAGLKDRAFVVGWVRTVRRAREWTRRALERRGWPVYPSEANFLLVRFGEEAPRVLRRLRRGRVLVRDRSRDPGLGGCLRVTIGTMGQMRRFIETLDG
jgi:histidinol-phosphate aminotransferase